MQTSNVVAGTSLFRQYCLVKRGSLLFAAVCFATIYNNDGFENRDQKYIKINNCQKYANISTICDVKIQYSRSEMRTIPRCCLSQSGTGLIKLL
jgi:hypothetical protein